MKYLRVIFAALLVVALQTVSYGQESENRAYNEVMIDRLSALSDRENITFIFASDCHVPFGNIEVLRGLAAGANAGDVDFVAFGGDMVQMGNATNYKALRPALKMFKVPFISAIGNHDTTFIDYDDQREYIKRFGKRDFFFDAGPARFVYLNTAKSELTAEQFEFLKTALQTDKMKFVVTHRPMKYVNPIYITPVDEGYEEFRKIVEEAGVTAVFNGHEHHFGEYKIDGVQYITSAGAGGSLNTNTQNNFYHYTLVHAGKDGFSYEVVKLGNGE